MKTKNYIQTANHNSTHEDFEAMLRKFMTSHPDTPKKSKHGFHRAMNKQFKLKDHPRWAAAGCPSQLIFQHASLDEPMFAEDFIKLIY